MTWNYRVIKRTYPDGTVTFTVHEVFYNEDGKSHLVTQDPCFPQGETLDELRCDFELYQMAFEKPVLNYEDFGAPSQDLK
jgi:hypothetical protein